MPFDIDNIYHADWSVAAKGRWKAHAGRKNGDWLIDDMSPVGDIPLFIDMMAQQARKKRVVLGLDFPIGLCRAWYQKAGFNTFAAVLDWLKKPAGQCFFEICETPEQISPNRPFYPVRAGAKGRVKRTHLVDGLGVDDFAQLYRECEKASNGRPAAAVPFWTLGANQVGKAMLHGWQNLLLPGIERGCHIWPFDGELGCLLHQPGMTLIETYPGEIYGWLGLHHLDLPSGRFAKSRQPSRREVLAQLIPDLAKQGIHITPKIQAQIANGIDNANGKDDAFDAFIGVIGLILIAIGKRSENLPDSNRIQTQEGWIIGMIERPRPK